MQNLLFPLKMGLDPFHTHKEVHGIKVSIIEPLILTVKSTAIVWDMTMRSKASIGKLTRNPHTTRPRSWKTCPQHSPPCHPLRPPPPLRPRTFPLH